MTAIALGSAPRPCLLFAADDAQTIRERARRRGVDRRLRARCDDLLRTGPRQLHDTPKAADSAAALTAAGGYFLLNDPDLADWSKRRVEALLALDTWVAAVHRSFTTHCDHVMTNIAAHIALSHDLLADRYTPEQTKALIVPLRRLWFEPFLASMRGRTEPWTKADYNWNWKIMCCGESGTAICAFHEHLAEAGEGLDLAIRGVNESLDTVPAEGDWAEGLDYWFTTLCMGLRFATALKRLTGGAIDLYRHPRLATTGDFAVMLVTPGGKVYNFNDNRDRVGEMSSTGLAMLACSQRRGDWMAVARRFAADSIAHVAFDDPNVHATPPQRLAALFPSTGVATMRSGWGDRDTFVGFKCGPSTVGHSHLDAASFVVESAGRTLVRDNGYWPSAHFLGFFHEQCHRWSFDGNASVGHSSLLVDGQGQRWGKPHAGRIVRLDDGEGWHLVVGDASRTYGNLLEAFVRSIAFLHPDCIVIRDQVVCRGARHVEWLLHPEGSVTDHGSSCVIENDGVTLCVTPLLPDRTMGWRVSDVTRTSTYEDSDKMEMVSPSIRYRSFSPFRAAERFEFVFAMRVGGKPDGGDWMFDPQGSDWTLRAAGRGLTLRADANDLRVVADQHKR